MINKLKELIDFAIFSTEPDKYVNTSNLSTKLYQCQQKIDNIQRKYNDVIDPRSEKKLNELKKKTLEKITTLQEEAKTAKRRERKDLEERIYELKEALKEIQVIIRSKTNYVFNVVTKPYFGYDDSTDTGSINYNGTLGGLLNELKHAFQYENGEIDFIKTTNSKGVSKIIAGVLYDANDENETYKRQCAFDGILKVRVHLNQDEIIKQFKTGKIKKSLGLGILEIKEMKKITVNLMIKIVDNFGGIPLYKNLSKRSLNINSSIKDIKKGNRKRKVLFNALGLNKETKSKPYIDFIKANIETKPYIYVKY